jgi:hypothetical protein
MDLAERYGVSRHVIRKAMDLLEQRGVLGGRQGSGTYVRGKLVDYQITARTRYNDNVRKLDEASSFELLELQVRRASIEMARALAMPRQSRVFDLYILRWTGRDPLCLARHYFSAERFPDLAEHLPAATGIGDLLRRMGTPDFRRSSSTISARQPTRAEARSSCSRAAMSTSQGSRSSSAHRSGRPRASRCTSEARAEPSRTPVRFGERPLPIPAVPALAFTGRVSAVSPSFAEAGAVHREEAGQQGVPNLSVFSSH